MRLNVKSFELILAEKCLTFKELCQECDISTVTLVKLRNGAYGKPQTMGKIAKGLGVKVTEIIEN